MPRSTHLYLAFVTLLPLSITPSVDAHPIPKERHDRTLVVTLTQTAADIVEVKVQFRLAVHEYTAKVDVFQHGFDIDVYKHTAKGLDTRTAFHREYARVFAPILASQQKLQTQIDSIDVLLVCRKYSHTMTDEKGQRLKHLRCDFVYTATVKVDPNKTHHFQLHDNNWVLNTDKLDIGVQAGSGIHLTNIHQASRELKNKSLVLLDGKTGEPTQLRRVAADFKLVDSVTPPQQSTPPRTTPPANQADSHTSLVDLLHDYREAIWLLLILSAFFGAAHALTPGHGKTLMAAYLVGEHGTIFHALILGLVTTFTHTAIVLMFAAGLLFVPQSWLMSVIRVTQLAFGFIIAGIGFYLLVCRLSGRADHVHIGGSHHHHDHGHDHHHSHHHHDHDHDEHGHVIPKTRVGMWGLIIMGMQGGLIPCWDAVALLCYAVATGLLYFALPMVLAFSAGLASVLVVIGIAVVSSKRFAETHWGANRLIQALPIVSACLVIAIGIWLCYDGVHGAH